MAPKRKPPKTPSLQYLLVLLAEPSTSKPPFCGWLIHVDATTSPGNLIIRNRPKSGIQVIRIQIKAQDYDPNGTFINPTGVVLEGTYLHDKTLIKECSVVIGSNQPWIQGLWDHFWKSGAFRLRYKHGSRSRQETCKRFLTMMLLWDFWAQNSLTDDCRNEDLKALGLVSPKSGRGSFATDTARAGFERLPGFEKYFDNRRAHYEYDLTDPIESRIYWEDYWEKD